MSIIGTLVGYALTVFILLLVVRAVLDWTGMVAGGSGWAIRARSVTRNVTEPVIGPVRRRLRPVRAGGFSIDIAFTLVFVVALVLRSIAFSL
jgi:YggT family protein